MVPIPYVIRPKNVSLSHSSCINSLIVLTPFSVCLTGFTSLQSVILTNYIRYNNTSVLLSSILTNELIFPISSTVNYPLDQAPVFCFGEILELFNFEKISFVSKAIIFMLLGHIFWRQC